MNHFHIVWSIFTNIQIFSLIHCYLSTTPVPILSWVYFNTPAILFNRSDSVATLAKINKRNWSLKKKKIKQNLHAIAEDFSLKKLVYIQGSLALCQPFFPYKPHTQTFLTFQPKWAPEEELWSKKLKFTTTASHVPFLRRLLLFSHLSLLSQTH